MITVEINDAQVRQALDEVARALTDLTPAMQDIGEYLTETTKERFREGVSPEGTPWAPKSQATIAEAGQFGARIGTDKRGRSYFMPIPWGDIPARPFLGLSAEDRTGVLEILEEYVTGAQE